MEAIISPTPKSAPSNTPQLARDLRVSHATAVVVGTIIGSGIFLVPAEMMRAVGTAKLVYLAWIVGGILSFLGALTYAELGAMKPQSGGEYVYVRDAYGPLMSFLYAWSWFVIAKPGSMATIATGMMQILGGYPALSFLPKNVVSGVPFTYAQLAAVALIIFISAVNYIGVKKAGQFQVVFTVLKLAIIFGVIVVGFFAGHGSWSNFTTSFTGATGGIAGFMIALVAALWAYDGWNDINMVAEEIDHPERNVPIALIVGVGIVAALYMLLNAAVQYALPAQAIAMSKRAASDAVLVSIGAGAASIFAALMAIQMLATINGTTLSGARIPYALARDGYFFEAIGKVHPRYLTPANAIVFQGALAVILVSLVGKFQQLFSLTIFAEWLFYMIATSTVFVFRRREPNANRPYKTWGYPVVPAVFIAAAAMLLCYTFVDNLKYAMIPTTLIGPPLNSISTGGALVILLGVPVFWWFARQKSLTTKGTKEL
ncbi:amino acid/polyamine/organocation transporter, APC superfamily [Candidatus Koribacter versatilis Ellin345]|uniref:Amino acid/polyamine/organocation transporter, APC superfamily n=1 Tax=Koribacter versatilis (strain Ellin345) TaxID=204669 RepID=Q1IL98_KORVE|nr:amino acid permease [Candidatus Koribacter versatilis]ABF42352.1 amino acid/polyamine/organocation transporter, APC superfamily [Candidatus Koribacter versatilis Ellin345]